MPQKKKTEPEAGDIYTGYGRIADGENNFYKVRATDFGIALKELTRKIKVEHGYRGNSRKITVYIEFVIKNNLQLVGDGEDPSFFEVDEVSRHPFIRDFDKEVERQMEIIFHCGTLSEEEEGLEEVLIKIAIHRAAKEFRLLHPDHKALEERLEKF